MRINLLIRTIFIDGRVFTAGNAIADFKLTIAYPFQEIDLQPNSIFPDKLLKNKR